MRSISLFLRFWELPPRARRIHTPIRGHGISHGTTSACAENTGCARYPWGLAGNYLRVRGEYRVKDLEVYAEMELPPRARRIPQTSPGCPNRTGNYLRVRGEYPSVRLAAKN